MVARRCGMARLGCPRPDDPITIGSEDHLFADYEVFEVYHPECCDNPDCLDDHPERA